MESHTQQVSDKLTGIKIIMKLSRLVEPEVTVFNLDIVAKVASCKLVLEYINSLMSPFVVTRPTNQTLYTSLFAGIHSDESAMLFAIQKAQ